MPGFRRLCTVLAACITASTGAWGQLNIPTIIQLPDEDFIWPWGQSPGIDDRSRPEFTLNGVESKFRCTAVGAFKPGSRMRDENNRRNFEQALDGSIYFIQAVTDTFNNLILSNDLQWAELDCAAPTASATEIKEQERLDKALERAQRDRERRRAREAERAED